MSLVKEVRLTPDHGGTAARRVCGGTAGLIAAGGHDITAVRTCRLRRRRGDGLTIAFTGEEIWR